MAKAIREDEKVFYMDDGKRIAKSGIKDPKLLSRLASEASAATPNISPKIEQPLDQNMEYFHNREFSMENPYPDGLDKKFSMVPDPIDNSAVTEPTVVPDPEPDRAQTGGSVSSGLSITPGVDVDISPELSRMKAIESELDTLGKQGIGMANVPEDPDLSGPAPIKPYVSKIEDFATPETKEYDQIKELESSGEAYDPARLQELQGHKEAQAERYMVDKEAIGKTMDEYKVKQSAWVQEQYKSAPGLRNQINLANESFGKVMESQTSVLKATHKMIEQESADIKNMKVDPARLWKRNQSAVIMMAIGAGLQSFGANLTGHGDPSAGLRVMNAAIDRDIEDQVFAIKNKRAGIMEMKSGLEMKMQVFGSEKAAILAHKGNMMEALGVKMEEHQRNTRDAQSKLAQRNLNRSAKMQAIQYKHAAIKTEAGFKMDQARLHQDRINMLLKMRAGSGKTLPAGIIKDYAGVSSAMSDIDDLEAQFNKTGFFAGLSQHVPIAHTEARTADQQKILVSGAMVKAMFGGNASDTDRERTENMLPSLWDSKEMMARSFGTARLQLTNKKRELIQSLYDGGHFEAAARMQKEFNEETKARGTGAPSTNAW